MAKQSGFLKRQSANTEDLSIKIQLTTRQFMIDTLQIAIHEEFGFGYDRIIRLTERWEKVRKEYHPAIDPREPLCDVMQEHLQRCFRDICKGRMEVIPISERYPYLKEVTYGKRSRK